MKNGRLRALLGATLLLIGAGCDSQNADHGEASQAQSIAATKHATVYPVRAVDGALVSDNTRYRYAVSFADDAATIRQAANEPALRLSLVSLGRGVTTKAAPAKAVRTNADRVELRRTAFTEWYVNGSAGLQHGFDLSERPAGSGPIAIEVGVAGRTPQGISSDSIRLVGDGETLHYGGLVAYDAGGRRLPARMSVRRGNIILTVDDSAATYPIVVDPFVTTEGLVGTALVSGDDFGYSIAIAGDTLVVGAPDAADELGTTYVFERTGSTWTQTQAWTPPDGGDNDMGLSGFVVAISEDEDTIAIGAPQAVFAFGWGRTWIYQRNNNGSWSSQSVVGEDDNELLGASVALSDDGETLITGAVGADGNAGKVYVFTKGASSFEVTGELSLGAAGASGDVLGASVAFFGPFVVTGAPGRDQGAIANAGQVFIFAGETLLQLINPPSANEDGLFGYSLAYDLGAQTLVVGERGAGPGAAHIYTGLPPTLAYQQTLVPSDGVDGDNFGLSVAVLDNTIIVGAPDHNDRDGAIYIFEKSTTDWKEKEVLRPTDKSNPDSGQSVALSREGEFGQIDFAMGAPGFSDGGKAFVYTGRYEDVKFNEIRIDQLGTDTDEYIELSGTATDLANLTLLVIGDGSGGNQGVIEEVIDLSGQTLDGHFVIAEPGFTLGTPDLVASLSLENSDNLTFLLVTHYNPIFTDLDPDDDCVLDYDQWQYVVDELAVVGDPDGDCVYSTKTVGPAGTAIDGDAFPLHVGRCADTDGDFVVMSPTLSVNDTPGAANDPCGVPGDGCVDDTDCASAFCTDGVCCDGSCGDSDTTDCQACSVAAGSSVDGECGFASSQTICRAADGECDVADVCSGFSAGCGLNFIKVSGDSCGDQGVACRVDDSCDGAGGCTDNGLADFGTVCGVANDCATFTCGAFGNCVTSVDASLCEDNIDCTTDSCDAVDGCVNAQDDGACDDGSPCTTDACGAVVGCVSTDICDDGVACTLESCGTHQASTQSCADLGWEDDFGSAEVCTTSFMDEGCSEFVDYATANLRCTDAGGRLCTTEELSAQEARGGGCSFNNARTWSGTACGSGYIITQAGGGSQFLDEEPRACTAQDDAAGVIACCADANPVAIPDACLHALDASTCDDGDACTLDWCDPGVGCVNTDIASQCDDGVACTVDACDAAVGCVATPDNAACADELYCTTNTCDPLLGCTTSDTCDDGFECTSNSCDETQNVCVSTLDDSLCDDGSLCTLDTCELRVGCVGTDTCDDALACTSESCGAPVTSRLSCDELNADSDYAWTNVYGDAEVCGTSLSNDCSGNVDYTTAVALCEDVGGRLCASDELSNDETRGTGCTYDDNRTWTSTPCATGYAITQAGGSQRLAEQPIECTGQTEAVAVARCCADTDLVTVATRCLQGLDGSSCDDGDACTLDWCDPSVGCVNTDIASECDDGVACTVDSCDPDVGCVGTVDDSACDDSVGCTIDTCTAAGCANTLDATACDDAIDCTVDTCDALADCVFTPDVGLCDDADACTRDSCSATTGCVHDDIAAECDDSDVCTDDSCDAGLGCVYIDNVASCDDGDACTTGDICGDGNCAPGAATDCDDTNVCTDDSCDAANGCVHTPNTVVCEDGDPCTTGDTCAANSCVPGVATDCDDSNPCTTDSCSPAVGCLHVDNILACDDGSACTVNDTCAAGACVSGTAPVCDDSDVCTDDACDPASGCTHTDNVVPCDDAAPCTTGEACDGAGACTGGAATDCDDGNPCTDDSCDVALGCVHTNNGVSCNDGNPCSDDDVCSEGSCAGLAAIDCDDSDPCTDDVCDPTTGCTYVDNSASCDDGDACSTGDTCDGAGVCLGSAPADCNDGDPCTDDSCDGGLGCVYVPAAAATACDDGRICTATDVCDGAGVCAGTPLTCDDGNACTDDSCDMLVGCVHVGNALPCSDGDACTTGDTCNGDGTCGATALACDDSNLCTDDSCDSVTGCVATPNTQGCNDGDACTVGDVCAASACAGTPRLCDDGDGCTDDSCNPASGCITTHNNAVCDDADACTTGDTCLAGTCTGGAAPDCDDGDVCTFDACDAADGCVSSSLGNTEPCDDDNACTVGDTCGAGSCVGGTAVSCDDGNPCTVDSCDTTTGCSNTPEPSTTACDDSNACTEDDRCDGAGACASGSAADCDDGDVCTDDGCDPATDCTHTPNTASCNDGDACTTGDTCSAGTCTGGAAPDCDDGDVCTSDSCSAALGCVSATAGNTEPCDDGDACTTGDICLVGTCTGGAAPDCDDGDICTDDSCDSATGCATTNNSAPCDDSDLCTTGDACSAGTCTGGAAADCDDGDVCTDDSCDPLTGCTTTDNSAACDDGDPCTTDDACDGQGGCAGVPMVCDDMNSCTSDACNAGACVFDPVNENQNCDDTDACTVSDVCTNGECSGTPRDCDDGDPCSDDSCDSDDGVCAHTPSEASECQPDPDTTDPTDTSVALDSVDPTDTTDPGDTTDPADTTEPADTGVIDDTEPATDTQSAGSDSSGCGGAGGEGDLGLLALLLALALLTSRRRLTALGTSVDQR
ncbi:MAG: hypothetical protein ACI9MR_001501 [Myxococcota bacterium]|jgi:hypothetical protein